MNKNDISILKLNWNQMREILKDVDYKHSLDISSSCYVDFGICGMSVYKCIKSKWYRKTINYWKELDFKEFIKQFTKEEWEVV